MKKQYMKPQLEVVKLERYHMLAGSPPEWSGEAGSRKLDNINDWEDFTLL